MSFSLNCPFCDQEMSPSLSDYSCQNESCQIHKMPRYSRTDSEGVLVTERIILTDNIYIEIEHLLDQTTISKLDIIVIGDHVVIRRALKLDLKNIQQTIDKVRLLLLFS